MVFGRLDAALNKFRSAWSLHPFGQSTHILSDYHEDVKAEHECRNEELST